MFHNLYTPDTRKIEYLGAQKTFMIKHEHVVAVQEVTELLYLPSAYLLQLEQILVVALGHPLLVAESSVSNQHLKETQCRE
jgi:hypothetical protein